MKSRYAENVQNNMLIEIQKIEQKLSQKGDAFLRIKTDKGWMSCWRGELFNKLPQSGKVNVEIERKGDFYNITGIDTRASVNESKAIDEKWEKIRDEKREDIHELNAKILAKDILIAGYNKGEFTSWEIILDKLEDVARRIYEIRIKNDL